jgi:hypothetical protein
VSGQLHTLTALPPMKHVMKECTERVYFHNFILSYSDFNFIFHAKDYVLLMTKNTEISYKDAGNRVTFQVREYLHYAASVVYT